MIEILSILVIVSIFGLFKFLSGKMEDKNNNLTPPGTPMAKKKVTPPPSPYILKHSSRTPDITDPIAINLMTPNGRLFNFDEVPITPRAKKEPKTLFKVKKIMNENRDLVTENRDLTDQIIDLQGQVNAMRIEKEELEEKVEKSRFEKDELEEKVKECQENLKNVEETIKNAEETIEALKGEKDDVVTNLVEKLRKTEDKLKNTQSKLQITEDKLKKAEEKAEAKPVMLHKPNLSKLLAEEKAKNEELTKQLKYYEDKDSFKAMPAPTFQDKKVVKQTKTSMLRQRSIKIKK